MSDSTEKTALINLTRCVVKMLTKIEKLLNATSETPDPKRDKKINRLIKELEICNDEAMRNGLTFSAQHIARVKTGRMRAAPAPTVDQKRGNDHRELMKFHFDHIKGPIADGGAQGQALKFLLDNYAPEVVRKCYEYQLTEGWRGRVSWLSVKSDIGGWLARNGKETPTRALSASERNEQQLVRNIESVSKLRRSGSGDSN